MSKPVLLSGVDIARQSLAQLEAWRPVDDWGRIRRVDNIRQVRAWLAKNDPRLVS